MGDPQNGGFIRENPIKMHDLGVPPFQEPPYAHPHRGPFGHTQPVTQRPAEAKRGFDAYWTPLFGDGSFAAQLCEADSGTSKRGWETLGSAPVAKDFEWWKMDENGGK